MNAVTESRVTRTEAGSAESSEFGTVSRQSSDFIQQNAPNKAATGAHYLSTDVGWKEEAVKQFISDFQAPSDVIEERLQFLPAMCRNPTSEYLRQATYAAAFTSQGNQLSLEWMVAEGTLAYGRALPLLAEVLQSQPREDSTLVATLLLGMFEVRLNVID